MRLFFWNTKTGSFCLWSHFFDLYLFREGWLRRDMFLSNAQLNFSLHIHILRVTRDSHSPLRSLSSFTGSVPCSRAPQWKLSLQKHSMVSKSLPPDFYHLIQNSNILTWHDFLNPQATTAPLRRRTISLRLFGAAPVFSCVVLPIWTWCIARLQTIV